MAAAPRAPHHPLPSLETVRSGVTKIHRLTVEGALASLQSGPSGLSGDEARRRLQEFGPNRVERIRTEPLTVRFSKSFTHFFALILWLAAGLAFFAEWNDPGKGMTALGVAILGVILINGLFFFWQEYRAEQAIAALRQLLPHQAHALRDGKLKQVPVDVLVPRDLIALQNGYRIPDIAPDPAFAMAQKSPAAVDHSDPGGRSERRHDPGPGVGGRKSGSGYDATAAVMPALKESRTWWMRTGR